MTSLCTDVSSASILQLALATLVTASVFFTVCSAYLVDHVFTDQFHCGSITFLEHELYFILSRQSMNLP